MSSVTIRTLPAAGAGIIQGRTVRNRRASKAVPGEVRKRGLFRQGRQLLLGAGIALLTLPAQALEVGDPAPDFVLPGADGKTYRLADYRGRQAVVLAWFPKAYTYGCTIECKSLAENGHLIRAYDVSYFMASVDPLRDNKGFAAETGADFPLLSDEDKSVARAYGVLHDKGYAQRHTFYIGKDGRILAIDEQINPATAAEDLAATLGRLGVARP